MKKYRILLHITLLIGLTWGLPGTAGAQSFNTLLKRITLLEEAFHTQDTKEVSYWLAPNCDVEGYTGTTGANIFNSLIIQLAPIDNLKLTQISYTSNGVEAKVDLLRRGYVRSCSFTFDKEGRFTRIRMGAKVQASKRIAPLHLEATCTLPFTLVNGFIVLSDITLNGQKGTFILDSGCRSFQLNSAAPSNASILSHSATQVQHGIVTSDTTRVQLVQIDSLRIGGNVFSMTGSSSNLSALATGIGLETLTGLLGYELFKFFETHIDYANRTVTLLLLENDHPATGKSSGKSFMTFETVSDYLPVFDVTIGPYTLKMLFDTGANTCCLTPAAAEKIGRYYKTVKNAKLQDAHATTEAPTGLIRALTWGRLTKRNLKAVVQDLSRFGEIDGIMGYPVVAGKHISLNYNTEMICLY